MLMSKQFSSAIRFIDFYTVYNFLWIMICYSVSVELLSLDCFMSLLEFMASG